MKAKALNITSKLTIAVGFGLMCFLIMLQAVLTTDSMRTIDKKIDSVAFVDIRKAELVSVMYNNASNRLRVLMVMSHSTDPFVVDELAMEMDMYASEFIKAREEYKKMKLSDAEQQLLLEQGRLSSVSVPIQNDIVKYLLDGKHYIGSHDHMYVDHLIAEQAIPMQRHVLEKLQQLEMIQIQNAQYNAAAADHLVHTKSEYIISVSVITILLSIFVYILMAKKTSITENALHEEREKAEATLTSIAEAVITINNVGKITFANPRMLELLDTSCDNLIGGNIKELIKLQYEQTDINLYDGIIIADAIIDFHDLSININGKSHIIELTASPIHDSNDRKTGTVMVLRDVTKSVELKNRLEFQANHDSLTGIYNRLSFNHMLAHTINTTDVNSVLYIDLDRFKIVNDTCGHTAGDQLLINITHTISSKIRKNDIFARLGGDEFAIILRGCDRIHAEQIATDIMNAVRDFQFIWEEKMFKVTASIGITELSNGVDVNTVLTAIDNAMYNAKGAGRDQYCHINLSDDVEDKHDIYGLATITTAIKDKTIKLFYQTIAPMAPNKPTIHEILMRVEKENGDLIMPGAFLPLAERYKLMPTIDKMVIITLFKQLYAMGYNSIIAKTNKFSINISGDTINQDSNFVDFVATAMVQYNIPPQGIIFEITESVAISNYKTAKTIIDKLTTLGCQFALDDFGKGMSSLMYLKELNFSILKIDGHFVKNMVHDDVDKQMVKWISDMGHVMNMDVIAEFVETKELLVELNRLGVDYIQGYLIDKPSELDSNFTKTKTIVIDESVNKSLDSTVIIGPWEYQKETPN